MNQQGIAREPGWYYRLSAFFRDRFGSPVYKIPLDAGFSCPNRDGTIGTDGCSYCYVPSFAPFRRKESPLSIAAQIERGKKKKSGAQYLAYFQSYTNTYAPVEKLKELYEQALADKEVIGLSVATRPDCISLEAIDMLENLACRCHLWVEYGLQSSHDPTLNKINRGHNTNAFTTVIKLTRGRGIYTCAHIILGLPGETLAMMLKTIDYLNGLKVDGVKFHHLQVIKQTALANDYAMGLVPVYENLEDYIPILCDCLEHLSPSIVIHRLASQVASEDLLIAPHWPESAGQIASAVEEELKKRVTYQGYHHRL